MITQTKSLIGQYRQFIFYAVIGVSGVVLDLIVFFLLFNVADIDKNVATVLSTTSGILNNFIWNSYLNFKVRDQLFKRFIRFYAVGLSGIILTVGMFFVFTDWLGIDANIIKVASLFPVLILQYGLNKVWTFKK